MSCSTLLVLMTATGGVVAPGSGRETKGKLSEGKQMHKVKV